MAHSSRSRSRSRERSRPHSSRQRSPRHSPPPPAHGQQQQQRSRYRSRSPPRGDARGGSRRDGGGDREELRRPTDSNRRSRSRSRDRSRRHDSREQQQHRSSSHHGSDRSRDKSRRSRSRDNSRRQRSSSRDRDRDRDRDRSRRQRSRSRSRDERGGNSKRRSRDDEQPLAFPGPPPTQDHPAAKRSRWEPQHQQQPLEQQMQHLHAVAERLAGVGGGGGGGGQHQGHYQQQPQYGSRRDGGGGPMTGGRPDGGRRGGGPGGPPLIEDPPAVGSIHRGVVASIKPFGVFVAIDGHRKHVLVHHTQVSDEVALTRGDDDDMKVKALEFYAPPGQRVCVKILDVSPDQSSSGFRIHASMRVVDQESGADLDPTGQLAAARTGGPGGGGGGRGPLSDEPPAVGSIHRGEVKRIEAYGVFVALQGFRKYGLVHASQVANFLEFSAEDKEEERKKAIGEVVELGQDVWVKVVEVSEDDKGRGPKIGCSIKLVDQGDGTDLDPQNMRYRPRGEGGGGHGGNKAPIGAHAGEVKGGAIDWGYLATRPDAFGSRGYDLLDDPAAVPGQVQQQLPGPPPGAPPAQQGGQPHHRHAHHHHQHHHQQQQAMQAPMGRGRGATMPAWMMQPGSGAPAAPGSAAAAGREALNGGGQAAGAGGMTLEEALRITREYASSKQRKSSSSKKHKKEHKSGHKSSKHSKKEKRSSSSRKHHKSSRKGRSRSRSRSRGRHGGSGSSGSSSSSSSSGASDSR